MSVVMAGILITGRRVIADANCIEAARLLSVNRRALCFSDRWGVRRKQKAGPVVTEV